MSDEKVLTKEIAEQFLNDDESVDLNEFTAIEDAAAESLSKHDDLAINLDNLRLRRQDPPRCRAWITCEDRGERSLFYCDWK